MKDSVLKKSGIPLAIVCVAVVAAVIMISAKKPPEQVPVEIPAFLVDAKEVSSESISFVVESQGNVVPKHQTSLSAQVGGQVVSLSDNFVVGGTFNKGDVLAVLEQEDYKTDVKLAEAELAQAQAALQEEIARGKVAEQEYRSVRNSTPPELGLRKPQLAKEQANVKAAEAKLERAKRNLERTNIRAPYNGIVVERNIDLGQFVAMGTPIGMIYSTDTAEVRLPITDDDLRFVDISNQFSDGGKVILQATVGGMKRTWTGRLVRTEGTLDIGSRVVFAVVEVEKPYQLIENRNAPLRFGQFVEAQITSAKKEALIALPRNILRLDNTVLTVNENREIEIVPVDVTRTTAEEVYIDGGLREGALVVTSAVPNPYNGMKVRLPGDEVELAEEATSDRGKDTDEIGSDSANSSKGDN